MHPGLEPLPAISDRFTLLRRVGSGGVGIVYEAFDREQRARVALKTLRDINPGRIYLLKQEFRALTGLIHPNLVQLFELIPTATNGTSRWSTWTASTSSSMCAAIR